jgi:hypothetical protein
MNVPRAKGGRRAHNGRHEHGGIARKRRRAYQRPAALGWRRTRAAANGEQRRCLFLTVPGGIIRLLAALAHEDSTAAYSRLGRGRRRRRGRASGRASRRRRAALALLVTEKITGRLTAPSAQAPWRQRTAGRRSKSVTRFVLRAARFARTRAARIGGVCSKTLTCFSAKITFSQKPGIAHMYVWMEELGCGRVKMRAEEACTFEGRCRGSA